ncbi:MAG: putative entry exclusion protein TrbK-alt [Hyphomicrobiales bacterium]|nr:putative entry exclusion protein TrbK-alt [Hyphomicrobiales bacterium]
MEPLVSPRTATRIAAIAAVVITAFAAAILSQREETDTDDSPAPAVALTDDRLVAILKQCKSVTSDDIAALERCRHVWAESRRRFLSNGRPKAQFDLDPALLANPLSPKTDSRIAPAAPPNNSGWTD